MPIEKNIHFTENPLAADETGRYLSVHVRVPEIVKSWRIGMMDNVEIGVGRAELLTLAAAGIETMPVHIPKSSESDFKPFRADVKSPA